VFACAVRRAQVNWLVSDELREGEELKFVLTDEASVRLVVGTPGKKTRSRSAKAQKERPMTDDEVALAVIDEASELFEPILPSAHFPAGGTGRRPCVPHALALLSALAACPWSTLAILTW
jgi:hypothetical protein